MVYLESAYIPKGVKRSGKMGKRQGIQEILVYAEGYFKGIRDGVADGEE